MAEVHGIRTFTGPVVWLWVTASLVLILLMCWGMIVATQSYLETLNILASTSPDEAILKAGVALRVLGAVMAALAIGTAAYTVRMSKRVILNRQLPPPGVWVLGKPKVVFGDRAVIFGYVGYGLAAVLSIAGMGALMLVWRFVGLMSSGVGWI
jgi:hypothetical protein